MCTLPPTHTPSGLMGLVDDLQTCLQLAKGMIDSTDVANPVKITYSLKQLVKEAAVGEFIAWYC